MTAPNAGRRRMMRALRGAIFWMHLSVAITAGVVIVVMSATGVALAYQRQLLATVAARHRVAPPSPGAVRLPLDTVAARAVTAPDTATVASVTVSADGTLPLTVGLSDRRSLFVDPYTARVLGTDSALRGFFQAVERWHRSLAIGVGTRSRTGTAITGACNLAFLFLILSGFYLWWPRHWTRRTFAAVLLFDRRARGRRRDWNWHHVLGIWAAPVLLLIVLSATFMSYAWPQQLVVRAVGAAPAAGAPEGRGPDGPRRERAESSGGARASLDSLLAHATPAAPWKVIQLRLPQGSARTAVATVTYGSPSRPDQRVQLTLNVATAAVVQQQRYADYDPARKIRAWVRPVHTGEAGGLLGQTIAALASAAAVMLGITGFSLAIGRLRRRIRRGAALVPLPVRDAVTVPPAPDGSFLR